MRTVLFGWCATARLYLRALDRAGARPVLVVTGPDAPAEAALASACTELGVVLERRSDVNERAFVGELEKAGIDLLLVVGWPRMLGERVRGVAKVASVNVHPSLLPHYRGKDPLFWAILRGERQVGVTLHRLTEAMDQGPILYQQPVAVPDGATSETLAALVDREGAALIPELVARAAEGTLPPGTVAVDPGSHFPPVRSEHSLLDWTVEADVLERLVRACAGVARAHCWFRGMKLIALEARAVDPASDAPAGTVLSIDDDAIVIASAQPGRPSALSVSRWLFLERVHRGGELARRIGLENGSRLSHNPALTD
jgi:UDP-4-amino-4-deoxy-L-arabinose formyltransferase / UDP-glucuronic acid dehydrogenase (UDP-4-keto-hexauronic acid decarboxylating)